ncbi:DNA starvation/stationary phase protection protein [Pelagicoccus sp. SDUM812002]|uniref:DNA starvation/stationary phase protection protein n=1 Tax=Pelagicoccus sp. SDUM812002 TaxID=3041266 RepID=UPI00280E8A28|nr:DNA starvation/stationary phase protection protein [Pelagicoccus sp. SDUM812002]MDQ8185286.1 DNA starvation/stationary phase protection protein [Pelagicoccus sp. SDUM812002]
MIEKTQLQEIDELERNAIGLPSFTAKQMSGFLDTMVSSLSTQYHQYLKHHWVVEGPEHRDLHVFFEESYVETQRHLDAIAERMTTLGAVPTASMLAQAAKSLLEPEPEGVFPIRAMLKSDLENEQALISFVGETIGNASELKDYGTETLLKRVLMEREERAHEIDHYLGHDSLSRKLIDDAL